MTALVTQAEALQQLRISTTGATADQIADVMSKADQASAVIADYCKRQIADDPLPPSPPAARDGWTGDLDPPTPWPAVPLDAWTPNTVPVLAKAAILMVLTALYDGRTPEDVLLSPSITGILWRIRDPAIA
jgi:hypothetical protein